jgi:hypothetical protein
LDQLRWYSDFWEEMIQRSNTKKKKKNGAMMTLAYYEEILKEK